MQDLAYNALSTQTGKSLPVLKGDTPFFSRISSALTYFSGNSQEAQANQLVLILLVADIEEELLLGRPDGLKSVREHYRSRYFSNEQNKIYYRKLAQKYLPQPSSEDRDDEADVQTIDARTLIGTFRMCVQSLENFELRLHEANGIKKTIEFLTKDNLVKQSRQRRNRDL